MTRKQMIRKLNNQIARLARKSERLQKMADGLLDTAHKLSDVVDELTGEAPAGGKAPARKKASKKG